jgi:NADH-quinone oxidoreductase subunit D/NADH-quinone oxidoreductase subunit C/D
MDYLSALMNNWALSKTVEQAAGIETNPHIEAIRTIMAELQRLQSHVLWWGVLGMDLGAFTAFLYSFRDREIIGEIFEETIGARLTMNYIQPGGLMYDIHADFAAKVKKLLAYLKPLIDEYETLLSGNVILQERLRNIGVLTAEKAVGFGCTGPVLRASGVPYDLRKVEPYGAYDKVEFDVAVGTKGDCLDRYSVRMEEMRQSLRIVEQLIDDIPAGPPSVTKPNAKIKLPQGRYYGQVETARGVLGVFLYSEEAQEKPYRLHFRSPNFNNLWAITEIAPGWRLADLIAIQSSLDLVIPDIDR